VGESGRMQHVGGEFEPQEKKRECESD